MVKSGCHCIGTKICLSLERLFLLFSCIEPKSFCASLLRLAAHSCVVVEMTIELRSLHREAMLLCSATASWFPKSYQVPVTENRLTGIFGRHV